MAEKSTFWLSCRPRRIDDHRNLTGVRHFRKARRGHRHLVHEVIKRQDTFPRGPAYDHITQTRQFLACFQDIPQKGRLRDNTDHFGIIKDEGNFVGLQQKVDRDRTRAQTRQKQRR